MALDRADLSSVARIASQYVSEPRQGTEIVVKRVIKYLQSYPRMPNHINKKSDENQRCVEVMTDSDWVSDTKTRRSCSGGLIRVGGNLIHHWSKTQQTVALSSGEAEMNASVKAISEGFGVTELLKEIGINDVRMIVCTDSSACKGMILRRGSGKVKHLTTKQLWVQGAVRAHEIEIQTYSPRHKHCGHVDACCQQERERERCWTPCVRWSTIVMTALSGTSAHKSEGECRRSSPEFSEVLLA